VIAQPSRGLYGVGLGLGTKGSNARAEGGSLSRCALDEWHLNRSRLQIFGVRLRAALAFAPRLSIELTLRALGAMVLGAAVIPELG
jgi:hypothetical protein